MAEPERRRFRQYDISKYKKLEFLGRGSYGLVNKGCRKSLYHRLMACVNTSNYVAIKLFEEGKAGNESYFKELDAAKIIDTRLAENDPCVTSEYVIRYLGTCIDEEKKYIFSELLGFSLYHYTSTSVGIETLGHEFTDQEMKDCLHSILKGLSFLHDLKIVHRDLKLSNVCFPYCSEDCKRLKIIDLGSCKLKINPGLTPGAANIRQYRPPETILGLGFSYSADLWALGCMAYHLYCGECLFLRSNYYVLLCQIRSSLGEIPDFLIKECQITYQYFRRDTSRGSYRLMSIDEYKKQYPRMKVKGYLRKRNLNCMIPKSVRRAEPRRDEEEDDYSYGDHEYDVKVAKKKKLRFKVELTDSGVCKRKEYISDKLTDDSSDSAAELNEPSPSHEGENVPSSHRLSPRRAGGSVSGPSSLSPGRGIGSASVRSSQSPRRRRASASVRSSQSPRRRRRSTSGQSSISPGRGRGVTSARSSLSPGRGGAVSGLSSASPIRRRESVAGPSGLGGLSKVPKKRISRSSVEGRSSLGGMLQSEIVRKHPLLPYGSVEQSSSSEASGYSDENEEDAHEDKDVNINYNKGITDKKLFQQLVKSFLLSVDYRKRPRASKLLEFRYFHR